MHSYLIVQPLPGRGGAAPFLTRPFVRSLALGLPLCLALVLGALAPLPAQASTPGADDLRALIFYMESNDQRAVQAEMRRLRASFPGWTPPDNLAELQAMAAPAGAGVDVAPIWARIERGDFAAARSLIDDARRASPGWSPDAEMLRVLDLNEAQARFDSAVARRDHGTAIATARRTPALMRCEAINNAWQLAEMYQAAGQTDNALATYRSVLGACTRMQDQQPTLEKANEIASATQMAALFEVARGAAPANRSGLETLEARLTAGRGGGAPTPTPAAPARTEAPTADAGTRAPAPGAGGGGGGGADRAAAPGSLPLRGDNRLARVRQLKEAGSWAACLDASANPRSLEVLYERSWCAYSMDRAGEALAGFSAVAESGGALGGDVRRDSRFGMMLSYVTLNMVEDAARLAANTELTRTQRVEVESMILDQRAVRAFQQRDYAQSVSYLDALERLNGSLRRDLGMLRGYAYMNLRQVERAHEEFTRLHGELATDETRSALEATRNMMRVDG